MLKVIEIKRDNRNYRLVLTIRGSEAEDFLLAQKIFRALISHNFNVESGFGYDEQLQEIPVFKYPKNKDITLLYENGRYGATWIKPIKKQGIEQKNPNK